MARDIAVFPPLVGPKDNDTVALAREVEEELDRKAQVGQKAGEWAFFRPFDGKTVEATGYAVTLDANDIGNFTLS